MKPIARKPVSSIPAAAPVFLGIFYYVEDYDLRMQASSDTNRVGVHICG